MNVFPQLNVKNYLDSESSKCNTKTVEIKSCDGFTIESDCKSSLFGCQWSSGKCSSATECTQLSQIACEKSTNSLKDKCVWDSESSKCNTKTVEIKSCDGFSFESDCKSSLLGCQWSSGKCSSATECTQLSSITCEKSTNSLKDKCIWDSESSKCNTKTVEIKSCDGFSFESDCKASLFGDLLSNQIVNQVYLDANGLHQNVLLRLNALNYLQSHVKNQLIL